MGIQPTQGSAKFQCQIRNKLGHSAVTYYLRHATSAFDLSNSFAGMHLSETPNTTWYPDIDATHHMTGDARSLNPKSEYDGSDQVMLGNG